MDVVIAGAGSIGLLIGSFLSENGWKVTFFVRREEQAALIREKGVKRVGSAGVEIVHEASAETDIEKLPSNAPWIVAVKFNGVASILEILKNKKMKNAVLFVQNGFGHVDMVSETELPHLFFATVEHGAGRLDDRSVSHNGIGVMKIAPYRGDATNFDFLKNIRSTSFPIEFVRDAKQTVLRKVLINCMINPITAILQMKNGALLENEYAKALFDQLFDEIITAFPEMRQVVSKEVVEEVCRKTSSNESSMLRDRKNGVPMEIETIVSIVIKMAEKRNCSLPLLKTLEKMLLAVDGG